MELDIVEDIGRTLNLPAKTSELSDTGVVFMAQDHAVYFSKEHRHISLYLNERPSYMNIEVMEERERLLKAIVDLSAKYNLRIFVD